MPWNQDDEEINGIIDSNLKDAPPNPPAVNTAATVRSLLRSFWSAISGQVTSAVNYSDLQVDNMVDSVTTQLTNTLTAVETRTAAAEAKADSVFQTFQLADRLGTYNPTTGVYTISETGVTGNIVALPQFTKGKYFDCVIPGVNNIPTNATPWNTGDRLISSVTKWDRIPFAVGDGIVSTKKTNFILLRRGKNLVNIKASDVSLGNSISPTTGNPTANALYNASGFIKVVAGEKYTVSIKRATGWYKAGKVWISTDSSNPGSLDYVLTAPVDAEYVRVVSPVDDWDSSFQLELGEVATDFEPYYEYESLEGVRINEFTTTAVGAMNEELKKVFVAESKNLGDGSVTQSKAAFLLPVSSKNLVNPGDPNVVIGQTLAPENGRPFVNVSNNTTGFLKVTAGEKYTISHKRAVCYYSAQDVYTWISTDNDNVGSTNITVTIPAHVQYMRCSMRATDWALFQVEKGETATQWTPYDPIIKHVLDAMAEKFSSAGETKIKELASLAIPDILNTNGIGQNGLAVAPKMFIPSGREIAVYSENIQKVPDNASCEVVITGGTLGERSSKIKPNTVGATITGVARISDAKKVTTQEENFTIAVTNPALTTARKIINVGSSTTWRSTFVNRLMASAAATGITFLGIRESSSSTPAVLCEGRGGWALSNYSQLNKTLYSPFVQPSGVYMYLGNTDFWIKANAGMPPTVGQGYDYNNFVVANQFDPTTGYPLVPVLNTVVYDNIQSKFFRYSGSAWVEITEATLAFSFNFGKYRQTWGIAQPDIFHLLLGSNDFNSSNEATFPAAYATYKTRLDILIASVKADSPNCKILLALTYSSGKQGQFGNLATERRKLALWLYTEKMIADYSGRESENIILLDYHSAVDRQFGFAATDEKPFDTFTGTSKERYISDTTHLGADGFLQMGDLYFGALQSMR